ncbi:TPA: hypothetical protein N0F65_005165 [Lagenidium giganteum]|uniref:Major facilitator superfamily (MFS) profile domain-containing protein n=1 Tax=Lagenidium giganteum TaxID=4803 RepID=A0AAV2YXV4_9STRA|nr:TPA: hypothetical protein N0F65_005165 [Lagenidium giganteum]
MGQSIEAWLEDENIMTMSWPAKSPDLSPIENVWGDSVLAVYENGRQFESVNDLRAQILISWSKIKVERLKRLMSDMPTRPAAMKTAASDELLPAPPVGRRRYNIAFLCLCVTIICYADRTNIGIALPAFLDSKEQQGQVLSSFFYGYMATQIVGGFCAAKVGAKSVLLTGVIVWTTFDLATIVASRCLACLFLVRAGMGLGEGILFPCMHQISGAWYPLQERSRLVALVSSGSDLGTITALIVSPAILATSGWQRIFVCFGILSFIWVVVYSFLGASDPEHDAFISDEEKRFIVNNRSLHGASSVRDQMAAPLSPSRSAPIHKNVDHINWHVLLTSRPAWAIYLAHFCYNYGWYVLLGWIPQYFRQELHVDLGKNGFSAAIPYVCGYLGVMLFGRLGDLLVAKGHRVLHVRQLMNGIGFFASAFFLYSLRFAQSATSAVILLSLTLFCGRASMAGYWVNMIDIGPRHAAHVMGVSNTIATIPGIIGNLITGQILEKTGSWDLVFGIASFILVLGGIIFHCNASDKSIFKKHSGSAPASLSTDSELDKDGGEEIGLLVE